MIYIIDPESELVLDSYTTEVSDDLLEADLAYHQMEYPLAYIKHTGD